VSAPGKLRGLAALVRDAVDAGSRAVERVQKDTAHRAYAVLEQVPGIDRAARGVHAVHDVGLSTVHGAIRLVNQVAGAAAAQVIDLVEPREQS